MSEAAHLHERPRGQWWQSTEPMVAVSYQRVRDFGQAALERVGAAPDVAEFLLGTPMGKAIQGDHARGIDGLVHMVRAGLAGTANFAPEIDILRETAGTAIIDSGGNPNTMLVCRRAMDMAIEKARVTGIGWVSVRYPAGILTPHLLQAVDAGMIGMVMTQSYPMVAPHGGFRPMLGNAPIGFGVPAGKHEPVIYDAALTMTSASGVKLAAAQGQSVPEGFLLDEFGNPTTDAAAFPAAGHLTHDSQQARGTLLPLGGSHKAYGMIFIISLLTAVLADSVAPWEASSILWGRPADDSERYGSTYMAINASAFMPLDQFRERVDSFIDGIKASPTRAGVGEILYPGERSQTLKRLRKEGGSFLIPASHCHLLTQLAEELDMGQFLPLQIA